MEPAPLTGESISSRGHPAPLSRYGSKVAANRDVAVWWLDCVRHRNAGHRFDATLDASEQIRLRRIRRASARLRFTAGRWLVRHALARYLDCDETEIVLTIDAHGRPFCAIGDLDFNLSHAGARVMLALSRVRVGVDVESTDRTNNRRMLARRFFSTAECAAIDACDETAQSAAFFRTWVRKEAFVKALGTGIATGFSRFDVSIGAEAMLISTRIEGVHPGTWSIREIDLDHPGYLAAVAVRTARPRLRIREIEP